MLNFHTIECRKMKDITHLLDKYFVSTNSTSTTNADERIIVLSDITPARYDKTIRVENITIHSNVTFNYQFGRENDTIYFLTPANTVSNLTVNFIYSYGYRSRNETKRILATKSNQIRNNRLDMVFRAMNITRYESLEHELLYYVNDVLRNKDARVSSVVPYGDFLLVTFSTNRTFTLSTGRLMNNTCGRGGSDQQHYRADSTILNFHRNYGFHLVECGIRMYTNSTLIRPIEAAVDLHIQLSLSSPNAGFSTRFSSVLCIIALLSIMISCINNLSCFMHF